MSFRIAAAYLVTVLSLTPGLTAPADAAVIVEHRLNDPNIVIPQFDTALGTLESVELSVSVAPGTRTTFDGGHNHTTQFVESLNTVEANSGTSIGFATTTRSTNLAGSHTHLGITPTYANAQINLGSFQINATNAGTHNHTIYVSFERATLDEDHFAAPDDYRIRIKLDSVSEFAHDHAVSGQTKTFNYTSNFDAFLNATDQTIAAGAFDLYDAFSHSHSVTIGTLQVDTDTGTQTVSFPNATFSPAGGHDHLFDPRFNVTATFTYTVPEPTTAALLTLAAAPCLLRRRTRKQVVGRKSKVRRAAATR